MIKNFVIKSVLDIFQPPRHPLFTDLGKGKLKRGKTYRSIPLKGVK